MKFNCIFLILEKFQKLQLLMDFKEKSTHILQNGNVNVLCAFLESNLADSIKIKQKRHTSFKSSH